MDPDLAAGRSQVGDADGDAAVQRPTEEGLGCPGGAAHRLAQTPQGGVLRRARSGGRGVVGRRADPGLGPCRAHGQAHDVDRAGQHLVERGLQGRAQQGRNRFGEPLGVLEVERPRRARRFRRAAEQRVELGRDVGGRVARHHQPGPQGPPRGPDVGRGLIGDEQDREPGVVLLQLRQGVAGGPRVAGDDDRRVPVPAAQHPVQHRSVAVDAPQAGEGWFRSA